MSGGREGSPSSTKKDFGVHMKNPSVERSKGSAINILYAEKSKLISIALLWTAVPEEPLFSLNDKVAKHFCSKD